MGNFREHGVMLYLSKPLYVGFIRLQADKGLGRSYAGLLPFTEGMYRLGYISKEVYEEHIKKYSQKLVLDPPLTAEQIHEKQILEHKEIYFKRVLDQWDIHPQPSWRNKVFILAEEWKDRVPSAQLILDLHEKPALEGEVNP
ncbi:MAG: hypothetical protein NWE91_05860 [Candidatus Bathyarchaeota archaeon]|nr:hypothetical protein [Candidatus Bathyarchaeota archaeon]